MFLITFAEAADFEGKLGPEMYIAKAGEPLEVAALLAEPKSTFGKHLFQLLRVAWEQMLDERKLPVYELANKAKCFYFPKDRVPNDKVFFTGVDGETDLSRDGRIQHANESHDRRERQAALALCSAGPAAGASHARLYFQIARPVYERRHDHLGEQEEAGLRAAQPVQILVER